MSHDLADFQADVLDRSQRTPVLVDFWAAWCGPCKMLGPVLEKLADEAAGRWALVKIDTEAHQDLAAQFGIRGIPNCKLFHRGEVVAEFAGALPESQLRTWLAQNLPTPKRDSMARARELLLTGRATAAADLLRPLAAGDPADTELAVLTARALVFDHPAEALALIGTVPASSPWADGVRIVQALTNAFARTSAAPASSASAELFARYRAALAALQRQDFRTAAAGLVDVLLEKPNFDEGRAKAACLALFQHLGPRHAISEEFSRSYSMAVNS
ncbi:MAG: thioredoxin [Verrucomicrobia bacterium]|nr:thioredoxin [Verrucomicrobiota bacterium]